MRPSCRYSSFRPISSELPGRETQLAFIYSRVVDERLILEVSGIDGNEYLKSDRSFHHVILIDDGINYRTAIKSSQDIIRSRFVNVKFAKIVLFALRDGAKHADFIMETVYTINRIYE